MSRVLASVVSTLHCKYYVHAEVSQNIRAVSWSSAPNVVQLTSTINTTNGETALPNYPAKEYYLVKGTGLPNQTISLTYSAIGNSTSVP